MAFPAANHTIRSTNVRCSTAIEPWRLCSVPSGIENAICVLGVFGCHIWLCWNYVIQMVHSFRCSQTRENFMHLIFMITSIIVNPACLEVVILIYFNFHHFLWYKIQPDDFNLWTWSSIYSSFFFWKSFDNFHNCYLFNYPLW